jgi:NitT/TauT family transport system substrate-binding protein
MSKAKCRVMALLAGLVVAPVAVQAAEHISFVLPGPVELPAFATWQLARYLGYYADAGLDVELLSGHGGVDGATQVGAGNIDMAEAIGDAAIIVRSHGIPVRDIAVMGGGAVTSFGIREDSGAQSLKDLKGKKISVISFQDTSYYNLLGALTSVGLSKNDVDIQALGASGVSQFLINGTVQACACISEWIVAAQDAGVKLKVLSASEFIPSLGQSIVASDKIIKERPAQVRAFVQATLKAFVQLRDDPVGMAKIYTAAVPSHKGQEADLGRVFSVYAKQVWANQPMPGYIEPKTVAKVQDMLFELGVIRSKSPVDDLYSDAFVQSK